MSKTLVIVESPAKAKTISSFLGSEYEVLASFGHVRDLPEGKKSVPEEIKKFKWADLGVNVDDQFQPYYVVPVDKKRRVSELQSAAKSATRLLLATDEDREGESISWHVLQVIKPKKSVEIKRIVFHEITPEAIKESLAHPRDIDEELVRAQETRRILDRLYGYTLSPMLWRKVAPGLSAGRVQSVAVRLIVLRERERRTFISAAYSGIEAQLLAKEGSFTAKLNDIGGQKTADGGSFSSEGQPIGKNVYWLKSEEANTRADRLQTAKPWTVTSIETKPGVENPPQPFMTSTLQQEAVRKLGMTARAAMQVAQQLYEGVNIGGEQVGLITYMRTDSLSLAERALTQARNVIKDLYGEDYLPASPKRYKSKAKNAQEAHEAIRPTDISRRPQNIEKHLSKDQMRLYELIWKRTLACQMNPAKVERTKVAIEVEDGQRLTFGASGKRIAFPGFLRVYVEGADDPEVELEDKETILPTMKVGDVLDLVTIKATDHQTKPPARYTEASLVQKLEAEGVGRPSTYASIISTVQDRGYVFKRKTELVPTWTAFSVTEILENHFEKLVDTGFTAEMEAELDEIADGKRDWVKHLRTFYSGDEGIAAQVKLKTKDIPFPEIPVAEGVVVRIGRNGPFLQRSGGGPGNTASVPEDLPPADLTSETALELLDRKTAAAEAVAVDPSTGQPVFHKKGRYGDYLEVALTPDQVAAKVDPKRVTLPPDIKAGEISDSDVALLLSYPRELGKHPDSGATVVLKLGRYGAYVDAGDLKGNVGDWRMAASMSLDQALAVLAAPKGKGTNAKAEPIKEFGVLEGASGPVKVLAGRYGPYVTDGKTNATLPKGTEPSSVTAELAVELLKARAAAGPAKKKFVRRKKK